MVVAHPRKGIQKKGLATNYSGTEHWKVQKAAALPNDLEDKWTCEMNEFPVMNKLWVLQTSCSNTTETE